MPTSRYAWIEEAALEAEKAQAIRRLWWSRLRQCVLDEREDWDPPDGGLDLARYDAQEAALEAEEAQAVRRLWWSRLRQCVLDEREAAFLEAMRHVPTGHHIAAEAHAQAREATRWARLRQCALIVRQHGSREAAAASQSQEARLRRAIEEEHRRTIHAHRSAQWAEAERMAGRSILRET